MSRFRNLKADVVYILTNVREFGFSWSSFKADIAYMIQNLIDPMRERS